MVLDIFALAVMFLLIGFVIWLVVFLGNMPGDIARKRNHPQVAAITALGWIGILTLGASFLVAIVWAYYVPNDAVQTDKKLKKRVDLLEQQLQDMQAGGADS